MTLIDTVVGFAVTLDALGAELGVAFPTEEMTAKLGPPLEFLLEPHLPARDIESAADRFRELYPDLAVAPVPAFPGAAEALAAVRRQHGRIVLVTGKHTPNATSTTSASTSTSSRGGSGAWARATSGGGTTRTSMWATTSMTSRARGRQGSPRYPCSPVAAPVTSWSRPAPTRCSPT